MLRLQQFLMFFHQRKQFVILRIYTIPSKYWDGIYIYMIFEYDTEISVMIVYCFIYTWFLARKG